MGVIIKEYTWQESCKKQVLIRGVKMSRLQDASKCDRGRFSIDAETRHNREFVAHTKQKIHQILSNVHLDGVVNVSVRV